MATDSQQKQTRFSVVYILLAFWALILLQEAYLAFQHLDEVPYSQFKTWVTEDKVAEVALTDQMIQGTLKPAQKDTSPRWFQTVRVQDPHLIELLEEHEVGYAGVIVSTLWKDIASWVIPVLIFAGIWYWIFRKLGQEQGGFMRIGQSKAKIYMEQDIKVNMEDVAGVDSLTICEGGVVYVTVVGKGRDLVLQRLQPGEVSEQRPEHAHGGGHMLDGLDTRILRRFRRSAVGWVRRPGLTPLPLPRHGEQLAQEGLLRQAHFVPESKPAHELFDSFRENKRSFALTVDEYGGVTGLVTMEDLLECIFGDIPSPSDEADNFEPRRIAGTARQPILTLKRSERPCRKRPSTGQGGRR